MYHKICEVYGLNVINEGEVKKWVKCLLQGGRTFTTRCLVAPPSFVVENLLQKVYSNRQSTISNLSLQFPDILRSLLHEIVPEHLH